MARAQSFDEHQYLNADILANDIASGKVKTELSICDYYTDYDKPLQEVVVSKKNPQYALAFCKSYTDDPFFELKTRKMGRNICIHRVERMLPCAITGILVRGMLMLQAITQWILNPTVFRSRQHPKFVLPTTHVFPIRGVGIAAELFSFYNCCAAFVPKLFTTTMQGKCIAICEMLKRLPVECVELVSKEMGGPTNFSRGVSPHSFKYDVTVDSQYTTSGGDIDTIIGNGQQIFCSVKSLLDLVDKGVMDIGVCDVYSSNYLTLSEDAYHHVFSNGRPSHLAEMFKTVDEMIAVRQKILDSLHEYVEKMSE